MLANGPFQLLSSPETEETVEVIVADYLPEFGADSLLSERLNQGVIGLVLIGENQLADVTLPPEATAREFQLACRLLGEIVRLRSARQKDESNQQKLKQLAQSDPLTGLPNRRAWQEEFVKRVKKAHSEVRPLCVALVDIDHFKMVNTNSGLTVGDAVLQAVAKTLTISLREGDFIARLGGDEFALLIGDLQPGNAMAVVERVRRAIGKLHDMGDLPQITASAGYVELDLETADDTESLLTAADRALRRAKAEGRNLTRSVLAIS